MAGDYSKQIECNDQHFLSDCAHLVSRESDVDELDTTDVAQGENALCVIANVQSLVSLPDSENTSALLQTEGEENMHVENSNEHGIEQPAKEDLNVEKTNEHGTEQPAKEDLNVDTSSVLPGSDADNGEYPHNEDGAELQGTKHIHVDNNSVLPQSTEEFTWK